MKPKHASPFLFCSLFRFAADKLHDTFLILSYFPCEITHHGKKRLQKSNRDLIKSSRPSFMKQLSNAVCDCQWLFDWIDAVWFGFVWPDFALHHINDILAYHVTSDIDCIQQRHRLFWCTHQHQPHHHYHGKMNRFTFFCWFFCSTKAHLRKLMHCLWLPLCNNEY